MKIGILGILAAVVLACGPPPTGMVVILTDDQRADTLWAMPAVQALAAEGVLFEQSFVVTSVCAPSRATFLTGLTSVEHGVINNRPPNGGAGELEGQETFVMALERRGYRTAIFGKYLNGTDLLTVVPEGWDTFHAFHDDSSNYFDYDVNEDGTIVFHAEYSTDLMAQRTVDFINQARADGVSYFVLYAPYAPHNDVPEITSLDSFFHVIPAPRHEGAFAGMALHRPPNYRVQTPVLPTFNSIWDGGIAASNDHLIQESFESLLAVDDAVYSIVAAAGPDAIIIYSSDNGHMWGEHQLTGKNVVYEESIRVPLVISVPGIPPRVDSDHMVLNLDLAPTLLALAGLVPIGPLSGASLVPLLEDPYAPWRSSFDGSHEAFEEGIFTVLFPMTSNTFTRTETTKTIDHIAGPFVGVEIFDLVSDPYELGP